MEIDVNWDRVESVLGALTAAFEAGAYPYYLDSVRVPHDHRHLPRNLKLGGLEHAQFLWALCYYMRGGIRSVDAARMLAKLYEDHPSVFNFHLAAKMDPAFFNLLLDLYIGYKHGEIAELWVENAQRMVERWDGDPRLIFEGVTTYEVSLQRVMNDNRGGGFIGFREKMVSMILYYLMDEDLIRYFVFPPPTDFHLLRIMLATDMVTLDGIPADGNLLNEELKAVARSVFFDYAQRHGENPLRLCDAVWLLSGALCKSQQGNIVLEPNGRQHRDGRHTVLVPMAVEVTNRGQQRTYHRTCGSCVIQRDCRWNIPSKYYYVWGALLRSLREVFPDPEQPALFSY
jgi:hypothetical protein